MPTITIPANKLAIRNYNAPTKEGEKPEMIQPQAGDPVDFSVKGSVESIDEAGNATVKIAFINGERCEEAAPKQPAEEPEKKEMSEDALRQMAAEVDEDSSDY